MILYTHFCRTVTGAHGGGELGLVLAPERCPLRTLFVEQRLQRRALFLQFLVSALQTAQLRVCV